MVHFAVLLFFPLLSIRTRPFWKANPRRKTDLFRHVLTLTEPADCVLDCKGEGIFPSDELIPRKDFHHSLKLSMAARGISNDDIANHKSVISLKERNPENFYIGGDVSRDQHHA
jgi:hypothetical protein